MLEVAHASDVLAVWRLDRSGRLLHDLIMLGRKLDADSCRWRRLPRLAAFARTASSC